jgi:phage/plasmid-associated DNA primase
LSQFKNTLSSLTIYRQQLKRIYIDNTMTTTIQNTNKLPFMDGIKISLKKIPKYPLFEGEFIENIDTTLCKMLIDMPNIANVKNIDGFTNAVYNNLKSNGDLVVKHNQRHNIGRFYPDNNQSLIPHLRAFKHTLFKYGNWIDADMVKGHGAIAVGIFDGFLDIPSIKHYVDNFDDIVTMLSSYYHTDSDPLNADNIKWLFNMMIYGGCPDNWKIKISENKDGYVGKNIIHFQGHHPFVWKFKKECEAMSNMVFTKNPSIANKVKKESDSPIKKKNSTISYFFQIIENHIVYLVYELLVSMDIITPRKCGLEYDGLNIPDNGSVFDKTETINIINKTVLNKTGLNVKFKFKTYEDSAIQCLIDERNNMVIAEPIINDVIMAVVDDDNDSDDEEDSTNYKQYLEFDVRTQIGAVMFLLKEHPNKFIWVKNKDDKKGQLHSWTGKRWEIGTLEFERFISTVGTKMLEDIRIRARGNMRPNNKLLKIIEKNIYWATKDFKNRSTQLNIINASEAFMTNETVKFDDNADIIGFNNGVYDLIKHEFRETKYDDYITMSCGYDYNPNYDPKSMTDMLVLLKSIMPDEETRNLLLEVMSAGLTGRVIETFVLFNGKGRNGKGLLDEFLQLIYGDYCLIYANVSLLTEKQKTGGNPELASIYNKRIVIMKEPDDDEPLQNSTIKSITGGGNVSGRMLYSNSTLIALCLILIMECNVRPKFKSAPGNAEEDRVVDILFPNRFTPKEEEVDNITTFMGNSLFKTKEWKESHRDAFLQILIGSYKILQSNDHKLNIPALVAKRTANYLNQSFPILELFNDYYEKTDNKVDDVLKLKEVYDKLKNTDTFYNFTKEQKRKYNLKNFYEFFETHRIFREDYKERTNNQRNVLLGYKFIGDNGVGEKEG